MDNEKQMDLDQEKPTKSTLWLVIMVIIYGFLGLVLFTVPPTLVLMGFIFSQKLSYAGVATFVEQHHWYFYIVWSIGLIGQVLGIRYGVNDVFRKSKIEIERVPRIALGIALVYAVLNIPRIFTTSLQNFVVSIIIIAIPSITASYYLRRKLS